MFLVAFMLKLSLKPVNLSNAFLNWVKKQSTADLSFLIKVQWQRRCESDSNVPPPSSVLSAVAECHFCHFPVG